MVKVDREDGAAWKSLEHRRPRATAFIKVDHVNGGAIVIIQQNPRKHRCLTHLRHHAAVAQNRGYGM